MLFFMDSEVITAREGTLTVTALVRSISGVFAVMSSQFVRPCKPPVAAGPVARVWSLTGVDAHVDAQVRQLGEGFGTAGVRTDVQVRRDVGGLHCVRSSTAALTS